MSRSLILSVIGVLLCVAIFSLTFLVNDNRAFYFNTIGLVIVFSGTFGAVLLSYPLENIRAAFRVARKSYTGEPTTGSDIINALLLLSIKAKDKGLLSLEKDEKNESFTFLKNALGMIVDGFSADDLRMILTKEMMFFKERRVQHERVFRHLATLAPAFGIIGSVIGLIDMLTGIGEPGVILKTIPVALTSTLYGIVLANFFFTPMAEKINARTRQELLANKIVIEGAVAIMEESNPRVLKTRLESFLTPAHRTGRVMSYKEIREKYQELYGMKEEAGPKPSPLSPHRAPDISPVSELPQMKRSGSDG